MLTERIVASEPFHERVYRIVRKAILMGEFAPGTFINESLLAKNLGVSRSPIRDAMQVLYREGLVARASNGRYYVATLSREDIDSIYAVRAVLEGLAAHLACQRVRSEDVGDLEQIIRQEKEAAVQHDAPGLLEAGNAFHEWIIGHAANPALSEVVHMFRGRTRSLTIKSSRLRSREIDAVHEHEEIVAAFRRGDAVAARDIMEGHLAQSRLRLLRALESASVAHESGSSEATVLPMDNQHAVAQDRRKTETR